jgi:hypothetical protein
LGEPFLGPEGGRQQRKGRKGADHLGKKFHSRLFIKETFDTHLRGLLERLGHRFHLGKGAVIRKLAVGRLADVLRDFGNDLFVQEILGDGLLVQVDQGDQFGAAVDDPGFQDIILVVDDGFDLFRNEPLALTAIADSIYGFILKKSLRPSTARKKAAAQISEK